MISMLAQCTSAIAYTLHYTGHTNIVPTDNMDEYSSCGAMSTFAYWPHVTLVWAH